MTPASPTETDPQLRAGTARAFRAATGLTYVGGFFAYGLGLSALYAATGIGLPCPFKMLTGWECPLCGGTRMGSALLHGDLVAAFAYNPVVLLGLVLLGALGALWTVEVLGGPKIRPPAGLANGLRAVHPTGWLVMGLVAATIYTVLRNLL